MKIAKRILICICVVALVFTLPVKTEAYERDEHDKLMLDVLFKHFKEFDNDKSIQDEIKAIECACYLTIDQFNESGQKALNTLNDYGVKGIPKNISEIKISASPSTHRSYTHRGWDYPYSGVEGKQWPNRQAVMVNTMGTIFDFNGDTKKQESFCKLLYYIHILGDHMDDTSYKINNGLKMDVGGRTDKNDIIHEWLDCIGVVFSDQKHTHKYRSLTSGLERYNSKFSKIVKSEGGVNTDEKFAEYNKLCKNLMDFMTMYIPEMLKDETFFNEAFYAK